MRILFFLQAMGRGGAERTTSYLALGLAQRGHHVAVAGFNVMESGWEEIFDSSGLPARILFRHPPSSSISAAAQLVLATRTLRHWFQEEKFEIVSCTGGLATLVIGWLASRNLTNVRVVWHLRGIPTPSLLRLMNWRTRLLGQFAIGLSASVPLLISCSAAAQTGAREVGFRCKRQVVIYNCVDTERFKPDATARAAIRREWDVSPDRKLIGLVARLDPDKGHSVFLEAAKIMAAMRDDLLFVCVGDGPELYRRQLHQLGAELGLSGSLIWIGARAFGDMPGVFNALDVLCLPSYNEGFGNVLAEAMACGVPCVATRAGGVPEVVGDVGVLVPPGDASALANGMFATLQAEPHTDALRSHIVANFSPETMIAACEREFESLIERENQSDRLN